MSSSVHLQNEWIRFKDLVGSIVEGLPEFPCHEGCRPALHKKDILLALLIRAYRGLSYRRVHSDLLEAQAAGLLEYIPSRPTLNRAMLDPELTTALTTLIERTAAPFYASEDTAIIDSTWMNIDAYSSAVRMKRAGTLYKDGWVSRSRKLHLCILKKSRIIGAAMVSDGVSADTSFFKELLLRTFQQGFNLTSVLADAAYSSKSNYAFCHDLGIANAFLDFKKNQVPRRSKSLLYRKQLHLFRDNKTEWHSHYRFRPLIESVFSETKRKFKHHLMGRKVASMDNELLLKAVVYNLTSLSRALFLNDL